MSRNVRWVLLLVVVAGAAVAFWSFGNQPESATPPATTSLAAQQIAPVPVRAAAVERRDLTRHLEVHGVVTAHRDIAVVPLATARVHEVHVSVGESVRADQVLISLDEQEASIRLSEAEAAVRAAEANLARLEAGARPEEIEQLEAQVAQAEAGLAQATRELERLTALAASQAISQAQLEQATTQHTIASASLQAARSQLAMALQGAREEDRAAARAQLEQARVGLEMARLAHSYTRVKAPIDGVIASLHVDPGDFAVSGSPVARVVQLDPILVEASVGGRDLVHLEKGQEVRVHVDPYPGRTFVGRVESIEPAANPQTRLFGLRVQVENEDLALKPGMSGRISVTVDRREGAVAVPTEAVLTSGTSTYVYVVEGDRAIRRPVEVGLQYEGWTEVIQGVEPGATVVVSGHSLLSDGAPVTLMEVVSR